MARPLRVEYENACYHVINRGNRHEIVFQDDSDCKLFLKKLVEFAEFYDVIIHSYCLMPNHFHIQLQTRHANLSKFMQSFLTSFTISINLKHLKSGHLFQGRFKAQLVESELYKNKLSRYIHLNPVKINGYDELPLSTLKNRLIEYKWSSYRSYVGVEEKPKWLDRRFILSSWGQIASEKIDNYKEYVEQGIKTNNRDDVLSLLSGSIIGTEEFKEDIIQKYLYHDVQDIDSREQPVLATINTFTVDDIFKVVCDYYQIKDLKKITVRKGGDTEARKIAMFLATKYCRRKETLTSIAARFGVTISGLSMAVDKLKANLSMQVDITNISQKLNCESRKMEV